MKSGVASLVLAALAGSAVAAPNGAADRREEKVVAYGPENLRAQSAPNAVTMEVLKERKTKQHEKNKEDGLFDLDRYETWLRSKSFVAAIGDRLEDFLAAERRSLLRSFPDGRIIEPFRTILVVARVP